MPDDRTDDDVLPGPAYVEATTTRGYVGIGVYRSKFAVNVGTLVRSAHAMGGTFVFTVGRRYEGQPSAVGQDRHIPVLHFETVDALAASMPDDASLVCIEVGSVLEALYREREADDRATDTDHRERVLFIHESGVRSAMIAALRVRWEARVYSYTDREDLVDQVRLFLRDLARREQRGDLPSLDGDAGR